MKLHTTCKFEGTFIDNSKILNLMLSVCHENSLTVLTYTSHRFHPFGFTAVILLAESHFSIHTYPENNQAYIDLFMCGAKNEIEARAIIEDLANKLSSEITDLKIIHR